jgi:hypothetical protein
MQGDSSEKAAQAAGLTPRVTRFADIPSPGQAEGISVASNVQVAVGTFNSVGQSHVFVFDNQGTLIRDIPITDTVPSALLGVIWEGQDILAADFTNGRILWTFPILHGLRGVLICKPKIRLKSEADRRLSGFAAH